MELTRVVELAKKHAAVVHQPALPPTFVNAFIPISAALGVLFAVWCARAVAICIGTVVSRDRHEHGPDRTRLLTRLWVRVSKIRVTPGDAPLRSENGREYLLEEESRGEAEVRMISRVVYRSCRAARLKQRRIRSWFGVSVLMTGSAARPAHRRLPFSIQLEMSNEDRLLVHNDTPWRPARALANNSSCLLVVSTDYAEGSRHPGGYQRGRKVLPVHGIQVYGHLYGGHLVEACEFACSAPYTCSWPACTQAVLGLEHMCLLAACTSTAACARRQRDGIASSDTAIDRLLCTISRSASQPSSSCCWDRRTVSAPSGSTTSTARVPRRCTMHCSPPLRSCSAPSRPSCPATWVRPPADGLDANALYGECI